MEYFYLSHAWFSDERSELSVVLRVRLDVRVDVINLLPPITCTRKVNRYINSRKYTCICVHLLDPDLFRG